MHSSRRPTKSAGQHLPPLCLLGGNCGVEQCRRKLGGSGFGSDSGNDAAGRWRAIDFLEKAPLASMFYSFAVRESSMFQVLARGTNCEVLLLTGTLDTPSQNKRA